VKRASLGRFFSNVMHALEVRAAPSPGTWLGNPAFSAHYESVRVSESPAARRFPQCGLAADGRIADPAAAAQDLKRNKFEQSAHLGLNPGENGN
jgi:hypothetical protein